MNAATSRKPGHRSCAAARFSTTGPSPEAPTGYRSGKLGRSLRLVRDRPDSIGPENAPLGSKTGWQDDASLIQACRDGDEAAWKTLVERYQRLIYSIPAIYRLQTFDAEEVFQNVTMRLFENLHRLEKTESLGAWLVTVAHRECWGSCRRNQRSRAQEELEVETLSCDPPDVVRALHAVQSEHVLALALERMDPKSRELLTALYLEEPRPSNAEISRRLGRPMGSLGPTRSRCLEKLRRIYVELGG